MKSISKKYSLPILVSTHPRTKNKLLKHKIIIKDKNIKFLKPFGFFEYINLQKNSYCVISDSGSLFEEASLLNFNAISLRNSHERYEGIEYSSIILSSIDKKYYKIIKNIKANTYYEKPKDYLGGHVSKKIVQVILSNLNRLKLKKKLDINKINSEYLNLSLKILFLKNLIDCLILLSILQIILFKI